MSIFYKIHAKLQLMVLHVIKALKARGEGAIVSID